jgi:hypothetical protein
MPTLAVGMLFLTPGESKTASSANLLQPASLRESSQIQNRSHIRSSIGLKLRRFADINREVSYTPSRKLTQSNLMKISLPRGTSSLQ